MLILALVIFSIFIFREDFLSEFTAGWNDGMNQSCETCPKKDDKSALVTIITIVMVFVIFLPIAVLGSIAFSMLFYQLLFRFIFSKVNSLSVMTFVLYLLILYNLFYEGIEWVFIQNRAFSDDGDAMESMRNYASMSISFMLLSFIIAYGFIKNSFKNKEEQAVLIQQKSQAEIRALKAQINPHFLFNTLNNLYGTALMEESPKTAGGTEQLAGIMRHAVESSKSDSIGMEKEIKFVHDYIEIQQIRLPNLPNISVNYEINWDEKSAKIAPLILMTFIENAFKYGVSTNQESFIDISLTVDNQKLTFLSKNSVVQRTQVEAGTGTGIENTRKRLELLYPKKHTLEILEENNTFSVQLTMNLA